MITLYAEGLQPSSYRPRDPEHKGPFRSPKISVTELNLGETVTFGDVRNEVPLYSKALNENLHGRALAPGHAPIRAVLKLQTFWGLSDADMLLICGLPADDDVAVAASLVHHMKAPAVKARLTSLMVIRSRLSALLGGDEEPERRWLRTPWARLGGVSALEVMRSNDLTGLLAVEAQVRELCGT